MASKKYDIICAGEILADLISQNYADTLADIKQFELIPGGSAANLANNLARLGNRVGLIAAVGNDGVGQLLKQKIVAAGVQDEFIAERPMPSTLILVTRSRETADFEAYRGADSQLTLGQVNLKKISKTKIFHTTCFGLSKEPACSTILACAAAVAENNGQLSIDLNYAKKIGPKRKRALKQVQEYLELAPLVKCSEVDYHRLFNTPLQQPQKALDQFLKLGAKQICLTLGDQGCWVADSENETFLPSRKIKVVDTTGAGDAFWSGYLSAFLKGHNLVNCAKAARAMAEIKLKKVGPIEKAIDFEKLI